MMRLRTYASLSLVGALAVTYHAFNSRGQFYPAMVYLSTSKITLVLLLNMGLVIMCILWQFIKRLFLGSLREAEVERLNEQSWRELMEILFAITIFRHDFSVTFLAMVTTLLLIKSLHWLAQKRVEYIETTPSVNWLSHVRIVSFLGFLFLLDSLFLYSSVKYLLETRQASVSLFFSFEYMILATTTVSTFVKYVFYVSDMLMEGQWEKKPVYTFYLEFVRDLLHLSMYLCFFLVIFMNYGLPLHLIRELYETLRNFKIRVADYIRYRKITSNMNDRFPDATAEEIDASDATCIICREEMTTAKKLLCGHLFHVHCLRSWLERQHTCPTCRALVVPPENGVNAAGGQHGAQPDTHQQETGTATSATRISAGGVADDSLSRNQVRLQAAAAAASVYEKSFTYPSANTIMWSPGYALVPQVQRPLADTTNMEPSGDQGVVGQPRLQFSIQGGPSNLTLPQLPHCVFVPFQAPGACVYQGERTCSTPDSELEAQKKFLQHQIEVLQSQLQLLQKPETEENMLLAPTTSSDNKGKTVASSPSVSESGYHAEIGQTDDADAANNVDLKL
ncbi:ERAD-associated E3 ubiquitin-protein ligase HRD1B-like [Populus nigra]|uniref:ERAD-associated E3 ubiquitin-protein ligase HRD1B-like n=1 Tax=Populus nigra TaxID=3691 RepID=UPI002B279540|nr:ERAD-associated E3 ubiquitin-protein ligase HRD1B-like [Populus nigra]XP_061944456.1 ERAD-associated E3 ubiquitin-protein ligase HRD1B-like [Populus nigra]